MLPTLTTNVLVVPIVTALLMSEVVEVTPPVTVSSPPTETFPVVVKAVWVFVNCMVFDIEFPTFAVSSREFPVPTKIEPILIFWVSKLEVLSVAFLISKLPWGVSIGISSTMEGGYFLAKWGALWRKFV